MVADARKKIGILFISEDIGVVYYIINIIRSFDFIPDEQKPTVRIYYSAGTQRFLNLFSHPYLEKVMVSERGGIGQLLRSLLRGKSDAIMSLPDLNDLTGIFPANELPGRKLRIKPAVVSWIPDFQHKFYPQFFRRLNLVFREIRFRFILKNADCLVLSSNDAYQHLHRFYRVPAQLKVSVIPFVSMIQEHPVTPLKELKEKFSIGVPFFLVSNQFYEHKNHIVVLKAITVLMKKGVPFEVFFSGKTEDYRNPGFFAGLRDFIEENGIEAQARILGMISREDQLGLLVNSLAVIQPSKFEGWNTTIEDAKTLSHPIICSSLTVHQEQMGEYGYYFDPDSPEELVSVMLDFLEGRIGINAMPSNLPERAASFARRFINTFEK